MKLKNIFQKNPCKNLLIQYKLVLLLLFVCGFNYKDFRIWNKYKIMATMYCVSLIIFTTVSTIYCCEGMNNSLRNWSLAEYIFSVAFLITYNSKLTKFSVQLFKIDSLLRVTMNYYNAEKKGIFVLIIVLWGVRLSFMIISCLVFPCFTNVAFFIISLVSCFALDVNRIWRFFLLEIIRYRLYLLRQRLEENPEYYFYLDVVNKKENRKGKIKSYIDLYKNILDAVDLVAPEFHASMLVSVICALPKLIISFYDILLVLEKQESLQSIGPMLINICQTCFLLFSPCIVLELHCLELNKIRLYLVHRLLQETDPKIKEDLMNFLRYTEVRSYNCKMWSFIPLNISLPVEIANICVSSMIFLINVNNLYG